MRTWAFNWCFSENSTFNARICSRLDASVQFLLCLPVLMVTCSTVHSYSIMYCTYVYMTILSTVSASAVGGRQLRGSTYCSLLPSAAPAATCNAVTVSNTPPVGKTVSHLRKHLRDLRGHESTCRCWLHAHRFVELDSDTSAHLEFTVTHVMMF